MNERITVNGAVCLSGGGNALPDLQIRSPAKRSATWEIAASWPRNRSPAKYSASRKFPDGGALRLIPATHCADT